MSLRFTPSKDGVDRANVCITLRYTQDEIAAIKALAERDGAEWVDWLASRAALGIEGDLDLERRARAGWCGAGRT